MSTTEDQQAADYATRDTMLGRARVQDNDELEAYYSELDRLETGALWTVANDIEPWEPHAFATPVLWPWAELRLSLIHIPSPRDS